MFVGCTVTTSPFTLHKTVNNLQLSNPNPNPNPNPNQNPPVHHSIKRTLSADMSSPKWLENNGFSSPMKRAQSFDRLNVAVEELDDPKKDEKKGVFEDIWSSILSEKGSGSGQIHLPPYVHPMVKRTSSLSEKSLEICTESLGSETGSDGFSFPVSSEPEGTDEDLETTHDQHVQESPIFELAPTPSLSLSLGPRLRSSFPPPLPSLANHGGSNVHMRSHRQNGRLVLEAVVVPSQNSFEAQRHDGRLLLTLVGGDVDDAELCKDDLELEEDVLVVDNDGEFEDIECGGEDQEVVNVQQATTQALVMSKFKCFNSTRPRNVNATIIVDKVEVDQQNTLLPPRPKMARAVSKDGPVSTATTSSALNGYEYYWRQTTTTMAMLKPLAGQQNLGAAPQVIDEESNYKMKLPFGHKSGNSNIMGQEKQEVVVVKAIATRTMKGDQREKEGEYLVPFLRGCKEPKRSLLLWEPYFIATS